MWRNRLGQYIVALFIVGISLTCSTMAKACCYCEHPESVTLIILGTDYSPIDSEYHWKLRRWAGSCNECDDIFGFCYAEEEGAEIHAHMYRSSEWERWCVYCGISFPLSSPDTPSPTNTSAPTNTPTICRHTSTTHHYDSTIPPIIVNTTATTHTVKNGYKAICDDCGAATGETGYFDAATREHTFTNGVCLCGYIQPASPTTPVPGVCSHNYVINRDKPVSGSGRYTYDNSKHTRVSVRYEQYCSKCGAKGPESGDVSDNTSAYHWFTEGYTHGTDEHWFTDTTCNGQCGYTRYENRKPHTYENGVCSTCGARAQNCQHEMVAEAEQEQVITQYDLDDWMHTGSHRVEMITYEVCQKCGYRVESEDQALATPKSHKFEGNTCQLCGYSKEDDYFSLLASIPDDMKPLDDETVGETIGDILWGELSDAGMNRDEIQEIYEMVKAAPATYQQLYLYSFFNYNIEENERAIYELVIEDPNGTIIVDDIHYRIDNTMYIEDGVGASTWFHESGHAIEANVTYCDDYTQWWKDRYEFLLICYKEMDDDVREFITQQATSSSHPFLTSKWNSLTQNEQEQIIRSIIGSDAGHPVRYDIVNGVWEIDDVFLSAELQGIRDELVGNMIAATYDRGVTEDTGGSYMATDCMEGMTNGRISVNISADDMDRWDRDWRNFGGVHSTGGHMARRADYWYQSNGSPQLSQCREAWAEYFSAIMTGNQDAINSNLFYFPETCAYFDTLAAELLAHYKEQAGAQ